MIKNTKRLNSSDEGEDSSDEDNHVDKDLFADNVPVIPLDPKDEKNLRNRLDALKNKGEEMKRGVVYLGRIPHGFYEEEMHAYFSQFGKIVPEEQIHENLWVGANKKFVPVDYIKIEAKKHNRKKTPEEKERQNQRLLLKDSERRKNLQKLGIEYDFPGYQLKQEPKPEHGKHIIYEKGSDSESHDERL
ncbi:2876_t:CDS:2 [Ambispora gerdemannii]|uniref:2876_t:CDS:1 n=1 Tax=Ambispora gerdemannii TaxID=144530 RepID=A0A9N8WBV0_9GLOM|nr:2876_t:CDS:2 [Ambispora gerdemannii]